MANAGFSHQYLVRGAITLALYLILSHISHRGFYYEEMFTLLNQILQKAMWRCYRRCLKEASWDKEIIAPYGHLEALISSFPCGLVFWNFVFVEHSAALRLLLFVRFLWGFFSPSKSCLIWIMHVVCTGITGDEFHNKIAAKQDIFVSCIIGTACSLCQLNSWFVILKRWLTGLVLVELTAKQSTA